MPEIAESLNLRNGEFARSFPEKYVIIRLGVKRGGQDKSDLRIHWKRIFSLYQDYRHKRAFPLICHELRAYNETDTIQKKRKK